MYALYLQPTWCGPVLLTALWDNSDLGGIMVPIVTIVMPGVKASQKSPHKSLCVCSLLLVFSQQTALPLKYPRWPQGVEGKRFFHDLKIWPGGAGVLVLLGLGH
jgi:hypothetical protein